MSHSLKRAAKPPEGGTPTKGTVKRRTTNSGPSERHPNGVAKGRAGARVRVTARAVKRDSREGLMAREMWVVQQASETEVCKAVGIARNTLRKWRDHFGWDAERATHGKTLAGMMGAIREKLAAVIVQLEAVAANDLEKLAEVNALAAELLDNLERIKKLDRMIDYKTLALRWTREFVEHLKERDPAALKALAGHLKEFGMRIALN